MITLRTGVHIPPIGFGTWKISKWEAKTATLEAIKAGYRLIDTARIYFNEPEVGSGIRESGVSRSELFVTTKLWNQSQGYIKAHKAFDNSLKRLGLEYVDLYLIHWPITDKRRDSWRALEEIYESGRAKAIGVSNYTVRHLKELLSYAKVLPAVNQVEFHPFLYEDQVELLAFCQQHGIVVEAYSPLAHGIGQDDPVLVKIAADKAKTTAQVMLRWASQHGTIPLPKSTHVTRLRENLDIFNFSLHDADMAVIDGLSRGLRTCWDPTKYA